MNEFRYQELLETSWRRELTGSERGELDGFLSARPEFRSAWLENEALNRALRGLPDAPVPSNFLALVEQAAARGPATDRRPWSRTFGRGFFGFSLPRVALGAILLGTAFLGTREYQAWGRLRMARSVAAISSAAAGPKLEWLENFDAIHELRAAPPVDEDLYSLLRTVSATHQMRLTPPASAQMLAFSP